jgi:hypothetical protein
MTHVIELEPAAQNIEFFFSIFGDFCGLKCNKKSENVMMALDGCSHSILSPIYSNSSAEFQQQQKLCQNYSSQWH